MVSSRQIPHHQCPHLRLLLLLCLLLLPIASTTSESSITISASWVLRRSAYLSNTHHYPFCSLSANGWDVCPLEPTDCYSPPDSTASGTPASASTWPSHILSAYSSSWGYYTSRGLDSTTSGWASHSHKYAWGCIISTWGSHYLIIGNLFILLYLHVI